MDLFAQLVSQYVFPIVACGFMGWYVKYTQDNYREDIKTLNENHKKEIDNITGAVENNTRALQKLTDIIEFIKGGLKDD